MLLAAARVRFLVQLRADGRSPHTALRYARHVRRFASWLDAECLPDDVAQLEPEGVARFLTSAEAQRGPEGRAKRTASLNALRSSLRGFFEYTERLGNIERSPARVLLMARVGATPRKGLTAGEVAALMSTLAAETTVAGGRDRAIFAFLLGTGGRLGNVLALALEVADVDLAGAVATLRELEGGGSMRRVPARGPGRAPQSCVGMATSGSRLRRPRRRAPQPEAPPEALRGMAREGRRPHARLTALVPSRFRPRPRRAHRGHPVGPGCAGAPGHQLDARLREGPGGAGAGGGRGVVWCGHSVPASPVPSESVRVFATV